MIETELRVAGVDTENIDRLRDSIVTLVSATGGDTAMAARGVTTLIDQFGLAGDAAGSVADALAATASRSQTSLDDLSEALQSVSPAAVQAGLSMQETLAILGSLGSMGLAGDGGPRHCARCWRWAPKMQPNSARSSAWRCRTPRATPGRSSTWSVTSPNALSSLSPEQQLQKLQAAFDGVDIELPSVDARIVNAGDLASSSRGSKDFPPRLPRRWTGELAGAFGFSRARSKGWRSQSVKLWIPPSPKWCKRSRVPPLG